jgi:hypothetical protein
MKNEDGHTSPNSIRERLALQNFSIHGFCSTANHHALSLFFAFHSFFDPQYILPAALQLTVN